jgi:hypothetical protein
LDLLAKSGCIMCTAIVYRRTANILNDQFVES